MTTVKRPHAKSKAAKIRKLILQGEMSNRVIADKMQCPIGYVYSVRMLMKKKMGIANLPILTDTTPPRKNPYPATFIPDHELAEALSKVEDGMIERKHLKQSFFAIVAMALLLAALLTYTLAK